MLCHRQANVLSNKCWIGINKILCLNSTLPTTKTQNSTFGLLFRNLDIPWKVVFIIILKYEWFRVWGELNILNT